MKKIRLKNIVWKEGKFYVAQCLNIDVSSFGATRVSALKNLKEAVELYLEDSKGLRISSVHFPEVGEMSLHRA